MELKMTKTEASAFIADALKTKCNIVGNVKVSSDIIVEVDFNSLVSAQTKPVEEPKEEEKKEEVKAEEPAQEEQSADAITSFFTVK
jgi:uncharacterized protein YueI